MTNPTELAPQDRNRFMLDKIRAGEPAPYQEGAYVLRVLSVRGRTTGEVRSVPIAVVMSSGERYLCGPNRQRDWVRNLLAAGECEIEGDAVPRQRGVLVEDEAAANVVRTYLSRLGRPTPEWPFPSDAPTEEVVKHVTEIAVFRLDPVAG